MSRQRQLILLSRKWASSSNKPGWTIPIVPSNRTTQVGTILGKVRSRNYSLLIASARFIFLSFIFPEKTAQKKLFSGMFAKKQPPQTPTAFFNKLPLDARTTETYDIVSPFSKVTIASLKELDGGKAYYIDEIEPAENEKEPLQTLLEMISKELEPPKKGVDPKSHVKAEARRLAKKYGLTKRISEESWPKIVYYLHKNAFSLAPIKTRSGFPTFH